MVEMHILFVTENGCFIHTATSPKSSSQKWFILGGPSVLDPHLEEENLSPRPKILDVLSEQKKESSDCCALWFTRGW